MIKRIALIGLTAGLLLAFTNTAQAEEKKKKVIAVGLPGTSAACVRKTRTLAETMTASLRTRLTQTGAYTVINQRQMGKVLKQHELTMVGLVDPNTAKSLGQFLQADLIMSVDFLCFEDHIELNVNLTNVETLANDWAKTYSMKNLRKTRRALKDITKAMKKYAKTGSMGDSSGKTELFQIIDARAFHDASEYIVQRIRHTVPKAYGEIKEINVYGEMLKVKITYSGYKPWAGLKLKVVRDEEEIGWVFLKKKGRGVIEAGTNGDMSSFEEGDKISSEEFEPTVAIGHIEDIEEGEDQFTDMFKERIYKIIEENDGLKVAEGKKVRKVLQRMGPKVRKKDLAKLHKAGVDLLIVGRFLGENGDRRIDFEAISTYDGKKVIDIKVERSGL